MAVDPRDGVCEAAFDVVYGHHDREFRELNGGMDALISALESKVRAWEIWSDGEGPAGGAKRETPHD